MIVSGYSTSPLLTMLGLIVLMIAFYLLIFATVALFGWAGLWIIVVSFGYSVVLERPFCFTGSDVRIGMVPAAFVCCVGATAVYKGYYNIQAVTPRYGGSVSIISCSSHYRWRHTAAVVETPGQRAVVSIDANKCVGSLGRFVNLVQCRPAAIFNYSRCSVSDIGERVLKDGTIRSFLVGLRSKLLQYFEKFGPQIGGWLKLILLGEGGGGSTGTLEGFKAFGLIHFVVVSGSHISLMNGLGVRLSKFLGGLLWCFCGGLRPTARRIELLHAGSGLSIAIVFAFLAGLDPPIQRSLVAVIVRFIATQCGMILNLKAFAAIVAGMQAGIWPADFLTTSNLMSWTAWGLILAFRDNWTARCMRQFLMFVGLLALGTKTSVLSIFGNLFILPFLESIFLMTVAAGFVGPQWSATLGINWLITHVQSAIKNFSDSDTIPAIRALDSWMTSSCARVAFSVIFLLVFVIYVASAIFRSGCSRDSGSSLDCLEK